jgi:hypothetical protein
VTPSIGLDSDFEFEGTAPVQTAVTAMAAAASPSGDPLGPLASLPGPGNTPGVWKGHGFNAIWRPHRFSTGQDRFLALNLTDETLIFSRINGPIPNRGLAMADIDMFGVTYLQQINEAGDPTKGLHIEPGIWANVPHTSDPAEPPTVVRMASIPHGTVLLAQGVWQEIPGGPQHIPDNNILPFFFHDPPPPNNALHNVAVNFPELDLSIPTQFRSNPQGVDQATVANPNRVIEQALQSSLQNTNMKHRTFLNISTQDTIVKGGGGTANTAFLALSHNPPQGNARAAHVEATFWIETIAGTGGNPDILQLQYTQLVMLDFNGIHWPHVTVGTLIKQ